MKKYLLKKYVLPLALVSCLMLSSCETYHRMFPTDEDIAKAEAAPACPDVGLLPEATAIPLYPAEKTKPVAADLVATGLIGNYRGDCDFKTPGQVSFDIEVDFVGKIGPAGTAMGKKLTTVNFPYFIAVLSKDDQILQRQAFSTTVDFDNPAKALSKEEHTIRIPVPSKEAAAGYKIVIGFRLTPDQLQFINHNGQDKK